VVVFKHPVIASKGNAMVALVMNGELSFTERWHTESLEKGIDLHKASNDAAHSAGKILSIYLEKKDFSAALKEFYKQAFPFGGFTFLGAICDSDKKSFFYMRDGLRPLHFAKANGWLVFFSETSHAGCLGVQEALEISAGEIGLIELPSLKWSKTDMNRELKGIASRGLCPFEIAYFQNYDSKIGGFTVDSVRREFGKALAREHPPKPGSVISWVPKSGISATQGYFEESLKLQGSIEFRQAITRMPDSRSRGERSFLGYKSLSLQEKLSRKFKINTHDVKGEDIIVIDDSIVRGNVSEWIAKMLNSAKPKSLCFLSAWPPMIGECKAGIDLECEELLALKHLSASEIILDQKKLEEKLSECFSCKKNKCRKLFDRVGYISISAVKAAFGKHLKGKVCTGCFEGDYSYIHPGNAEKPPSWLLDFISQNSVECPNQLQKRGFSS
ncbi:MAG: hypothetical protein QXK06_03790, partial [Candidatus Diapherotrites archaeon]